MFDVVIIGAGVIGLSIARAIGNKTNKSVLIIEKEDSFGKGISSRNSEVIHSGIYYKPGSLKSKYCVEGRKHLYDYCIKNNIWYNNCGKLVVSKSHQREQLEKLYQNAKDNGIDDVKIIEKNEINLLEPLIESDIALKVDCTGITSAHDLMLSFYNESQSHDHDYLFKTKVVGANKKNDDYAIDIENYYGEIEHVNCNWVINAGGLNSDLLGELLNDDLPKIKFLKGSYFKLSSKWKNTFKKLIYPLPDIAHGSLGIHLTIDRDGMARLGPNADWIDNREEDYAVNDELINTFYKEGKKYISGLELDELTPDYSGIRPKIFSENNSMPDFYIQHEEEKGFPGWINLIGIESPGLTASISIGNEIAKIVNQN